MRAQTVSADVVVIGGGLAGVSAAIAAARQGSTVALINNRPVLGGNSSSEVRVWVCGATAHGNQRWARESGIIGELYVENQYRNPEGNPIYWDDVVLDAVRAEENITLFLNTEVLSVAADGPSDARRIKSVQGWTMGSETSTTFEAPIFLDCTGDGLVGQLAGAEYRLGKEGKAEFGEEWAPEEPTREFLGSTLLFYTKDLGRPVKYVAPDSAIDITKTSIPESRVIRSGDSGAHYWWVEWGGELDIVDDNERIRDELRGVILGIWDYIKNSGKFDAENLTLEWVGNLPGKREYRRFIGDYTMRQSDVLEQTSFEDAVAFGGWSIDLHPPQGMYATGSGALQRFSDGVFEIPFRSLYSVNVENLLMAGRNISATHVAFGAARVMATCAAMGEAAGLAAALCAQDGSTPRAIYQLRSKELQQRLLREDASLIGVANQDPQDLALQARVTASSYVGQVATHPSGAAWHQLDSDIAVVIPVSSALESVEFQVSADAETELVVETYSTGLGQNIVPKQLEHQTTVTVPAGEGTVRAEIQFSPARAVNAIVVLRKAPLMVQLTDDLLPGLMTLTQRLDSDDQNVEVSTEELLIQWPSKPLRGLAPVFSALPAAEVYAPQQAIGGYQRPFDGPNMWVAERTDEQPWLRLDWAEPVTARQVRLVFDDDVDIELNTLHHHRTPAEILPSLVRDYRVEVSVDGSWQQVIQVSENRRRQRVHQLPVGLRFQALRVVVESTNGAQEARIVALRVQA